MTRNHSVVSTGNPKTVRKKIMADVSGDTFSRIARYLPLCVAVILACGVFISMMLGLKPNHLFKEGRLFTHFSGLLLLFVGATCLHIFRLRWKSESIPWQHLISRGYFIWLIMGLGFVFLWADEVACYHEKMGDWIQNANPNYTGILAERFDSLIIGLYGIGSLVVLWVYRYELLEFKMYSIFFITGFTLLFLMVGLDFLTEDMKIIRMMTTEKQTGERVFIFLEVLEDLFKLLAIAFFLRGFLGIRWQIISQQRLEYPASSLQ